MSSTSHHITPSPNTIPKSRHGEIDLTQRFSEQMAKLCMSSNYSDVTFIIESVRIPAHRVVLAARCEYFRALLYGGLSESNQAEITLKIPLEGFKALLNYIYSGQMCLSKMKEETIFDTLGLVNQYGFTELELAISQYLRQTLSLANACAILDAARLYDLDSLIQVCHRFMDRNADKILSMESFRSLSQESLIGILQRDSFFAPEADIFVAVHEWCECNPTADIASVVSHVRLPLMNIEQLLSVVRPSKILNPDSLLDAIAEKTTSKYLPYRGLLIPEENVASLKYGSRTIQGELRSALLDGDTSKYDMEKGYTRHTINETGDQGIIVELGTISIINHIQMLLWDRDTRSYSYYIEISVDQTNWERVIDYTNYNCRSWQKLYFPQRAVKFIRLVGTHNTVNTVFHVVSFQAMYSLNVPSIVDGVLEPTENVATIEHSATVIEGVSRTRNALLNGNTRDYDFESGYTCHQLGHGVIIIQLGQPYYIGSLRLLLWDCDMRSYSFYIETSVNQKDWEVVVDKRNELLQSWQHCTFPPRPVLFIKLVGTHNTINDIFHCVHFECPSQDPTYLQTVKEPTVKCIEDTSVDAPEVVEIKQET